MGFLSYRGLRAALCHSRIPRMQECEDDGSISSGSQHSHTSKQATLSSAYLAYSHKVRHWKACSDPCAMRSAQVMGREGGQPMHAFTTRQQLRVVPALQAMLAVRHRCRSSARWSGQKRGSFDEECAPSLLVGRRCSLLYVSYMLCAA